MIFPGPSMLNQTLVNRPSSSSFRQLFDPNFNISTNPHFSTPPNRGPQRHPRPASTPVPSRGLSLPATQRIWPRPAPTSRWRCPSAPPVPPEKGPGGAKGRSEGWTNSRNSPRNARNWAMGAPGSVNRCLVSGNWRVDITIQFMGVILGLEPTHNWGAPSCRG